MYYCFLLILLTIQECSGQSIRIVHEYELDHYYKDFIPTRPHLIHKDNNLFIYSKRKNVFYSVFSEDKISILNELTVRERNACLSLTSFVIADTSYAIYPRIINKFFDRKVLRYEPDLGRFAFLDDSFNYYSIIQTDTSFILPVNSLYNRRNLSEELTDTFAVELNKANPSSIIRWYSSPKRKAMDTLHILFDSIILTQHNDTFGFRFLADADIKPVTGTDSDSILNEFYKRTYVNYIHYGDFFSSLQNFSILLHSFDRYDFIMKSKEVIEKSSFNGYIRQMKLTIFDKSNNKSIETDLPIGTAIQITENQFYYGVIDVLKKKIIIYKIEI